MTVLRAPIAPQSPGSVLQHIRQGSCRNWCQISAFCRFVLWAFPEAGAGCDERSGVLCTGRGLGCWAGSTGMQVKGQVGPKWSLLSSVEKLRMLETPHPWHKDSHHLHHTGAFAAGKSQQELPAANRALPCFPHRKGIIKLSGRGRSHGHWEPEQHAVNLRMKLLLTG